jgi:hypothetical protein
MFGTKGLKNAHDIFTLFKKRGEGQLRTHSLQVLKTKRDINSYLKKKTAKMSFLT